VCNNNNNITAVKLWQYSYVRIDSKMYNKNQ